MEFLERDNRSSPASRRVSVKKPILVVTTHFVKPVETRIDNEFEVRRKADGTPFQRGELIAAAEGADALFITPFDRLDAEFFERVSPSVKDATADIAMLLLLGASRRAFEAQELVRTGEWTVPRSGALLGWQLTGKILGILGMGRIGQAVARRARAFGMRIHYSNLHQLPEEKAGDAVFHADPFELLGVSQFLSLHAPETEKTHHFLNAKTIALLPPGTIVINTARGGLIVDDDLIAALKSGRVAAAGLDVFEGEPKLNPDYAGLKNTFLLPHIGSATVESRTLMGMVALDNIDAVLTGKPALSLVTVRTE